MVQSKATAVRRTAGIILAVLFVIGAVVVAMMPYSQSGVTVCPSTFDMVRGSSSSVWLSAVNIFTGGACAKFHSAMQTWFWILATCAVVCAVVGLWRTRRPAVHAIPATGAYPVPGGSMGTPALEGAGPVHPQYAPAQPGADLTQVRTVGAGFDWRLAAAGAGLIAVIIAVSFLVQALSFLPGILQLILWAAVEATVIWQVLRYTAKGDPVKLARAERWNPANVARTGYQYARARWAAYRADHHQSYPNPLAPAPTAPAAPPAPERTAPGAEQTGTAAP